MCNASVSSVAAMVKGYSIMIRGGDAPNVEVVCASHKSLHDPYSDFYPNDDSRALL